MAVPGNKKARARRAFKLSIGSTSVDEREILCRALAVPALLKLVLYLLTLVEAVKAGAFDGRDVNESVIRPIVGTDEAIAFDGVEPLYGSCSHVGYPSRLVVVFFHAQCEEGSQLVEIREYGARSA
jgi:hypothetical protein